MTERKLDEELVFKDGRPVTASGEVGCVMLIVTSATDDSRKFTYKPGFFADVFEIEWPNDTMDVVIPVEIVGYLIDNGYARIMSESEAQTYNAKRKTVQKET